MYSNEQLNAIHSSNLGFEFEFFTKDKIDTVKESISTILNKKIRIGEKSHSGFSPSRDVFKIELNGLGGLGMFTLKTGSLPFVEAKMILSKTLKWIRENGSTTTRCSLKLNISFDVNKIGPVGNISKLDIGKFVLNFNEDKIYEEFPDRKDSIYAKSIKFILPLGGMVQSSPGKSMWKNYMFVNDKYYGVDFTNITNGHVEFRYLGGADYQNKYSAILLMIEYFITSLYETLNNPVYSENDLALLDDVLDKHSDVLQAYKTFERFKEKFPKIKLMVDLKTANQLVEMYYPKIREKVFDLLTKADMTEGMINYDTDAGKIQIKGAKLTRCYEISGVDIVDCIVKGNIKNCDIFESDIEDSILFEVNLFGASVCKDCKIKDSYVSKNVIAENCYIFGKRGVFSGDMEGGIFKQGRATKFANFSKTTKIIEIEKITI